jgi:hypothetical protein
MFKRREYMSEKEIVLYVGQEGLLGLDTVFIRNL